MNTIKFLNNNKILLNKIPYYKINYTNLYNLYYTINKVNYSNEKHLI